ncbi:hypothetical protein DPMN_180342 [Dreissena polymorpha]|uniref:Uncharacterized protein n=1 Tax=Dreissena polymorpha TaxID=45954 RepID=A0A9D4IN61_DREPO|nr:hypothetical protein DPMN_180342 [Dreissena polymorpha]
MPKCTALSPMVLHDPQGIGFPGAPQLKLSKTNFLALCFHKSSRYFNCYRGYVPTGTLATVRISTGIGLGTLTTGTTGMGIGYRGTWNVESRY